MLVGYFVLLDSGSSFNRNVGDDGILDVTVERLKDKGYYTEVLLADSPWEPKQRFFQETLLFLSKLIRCNMLWICSGGLFKSINKAQLDLFILRKLVAAFLVRLMLKPVYIDGQTIYLKGFWRPLFKFVLQGLTINCRDDYSLKECQELGLKCQRKNDLLIEKRPRITGNDGLLLVAVDSRIRFCNTSLQQKVLRLLSRFETADYFVYIVPTINTNLSWKESRELFELADISICISFHAAVFSTNAGVSTYCFYDNEYYRRKFSVLQSKIILQH